MFVIIILGKPFLLRLMLWVWPASLKNVRLVWKVSQGTNTLAYYEHTEITDVESSITLGSGCD